MKLLKFVSLSLLLLCGISCNNIGEDELPAAFVDDEATITLALQLSGDLPSAQHGASTRAGLSTTDETNVSTVDVLLFRRNDEGASVYCRTLPGRALDNSVATTKTVTVDIPVGTYRTAGSTTAPVFDIDVLTNARDLINDLIDDDALTAGEAKQTILDKLTTSLSAGTKWTATAIPMWGEASDVSVATGTTCTVKLSRMVARIDVKVNATGNGNPWIFTSDDGSHQVELYPTDLPTGHTWYEYANVTDGIKDNTMTDYLPAGQVSPPRDYSCAALGGTWRLPELGELWGIRKAICATPGLAAEYGLTTSSRYAPPSYWSASTAPYTRNAEVVPMVDGDGTGIGGWNTDKTGTAQLARCVRTVTAVPFKLHSVRLYNYSTNGTLAPDLSAWSATENKATAPNAPTAGYGTTQDPLVYGADDEPTSTNYIPDSLVRAIYTFEAPAGSASTLSTNTCLVVGGYYNGSATETFYRVDFATQAGGVGTAVTYLPLLRNHRYTVNITAVLSAGYATAAEAFAYPAMNIATGITMQVESDAGNIMFDKNSYLSVDRQAVTVPCGIITTLTDNRNLLTLKTDVATGWTAAVYDDADCTAQTSASAWLTLHYGTTTATSLTGAATGSINEAGTALSLYTTAGNSADGATDRTAYVKVSAGRFAYTVKVTQQRDVWAYSNVIAVSTEGKSGYDLANKLTFAESAADNSSIPANVQGVFFRFGSLVAVNGSPLSNGDVRFFSSTASGAANSIVYYPMATQPASWDAVPYVTTGRTQDPTVDQFMVDYRGVGYDATTGKGDICRYITDQGWVTGKWRMPTAAELSDLLGQGTNVKYGTFAGVSVYPETYGMYEISNGWFVGANATTDASAHFEDGEMPSTVRFLSESGWRHQTSGSLDTPGVNANYWSCSPAGVGYAGRIRMVSTDIRRDQCQRGYAFSVRCIRQ